MNKKQIGLKECIKEMTFEEVYKQFKNFIYKSCQTWQGYYEMDDLIQVACIGLQKAYNSYDVKKGILFLTYASRIVSNEILMYNRKNKKFNQDVSMSTPCNINDDSSKIELQDVFEDNVNYEDLAIRKIQCEELKIALDLLNPKDRLIVEGIALHDENQRDLAETLNISQSYVSRKYKSILKKLGKIMEGKINVKPRMTKEQLIEEVKIYGSNKHAHEVIAKKYGLTPATVKFYITTYKIMLAIGPDTEINTPKTKQVKKSVNPNIQVPKDDKKENIKPKVSEEIKETFKGELGKYELTKSENIRINVDEEILVISKGNIDLLIKELQELSMVIN